MTNLTLHMSAVCMYTFLEKRPYLLILGCLGTWSSERVKLNVQFPESLSCSGVTCGQSPRARLAVHCPQPLCYKRTWST